MREIKKILCAIDLIEPDKLITEYANALAKKFGATITVFYAAPHLSQYSRYAELATINKIHDELAKKVEESMKEFLAEAFTDPSIKVESKIAEGPAADKIIDFTENNDIDAIVIGTRGKKGLERILLGSVASKIIKTSPVPVFTVSPEN